MGEKYRLDRKEGVIAFKVHDEHSLRSIEITQRKRARFKKNDKKIELILWTKYLSKVQEKTI